MSKGKGGRPSKYERDVKPRFEEIKEWLKLGATDAEIAENLGVHKGTLCKYKNEFNEFNELIKNGRKQPVEQIKAALFKRATGFTYNETKKTTQYIKVKTLDIDGNEVETPAELIRTEITTKYSAPDPASCLILLKHWDKDEDGKAIWFSDPAQIELKKKELELKEKQMEKTNWWESIEERK